MVKRSSSVLSNYVKSLNSANQTEGNELDRIPLRGMGYECQAYDMKDNNHKQQVPVGIGDLGKAQTCQENKKGGNCHQEAKNDEGDVDKEGGKRNEWRKRCFVAYHPQSCPVMQVESVQGSNHAKREKENEAIG
jgi:hypothetical protein